MGAFLDLFRVLYEPSAVFGRVAEKPKFLAPFIGLAIITIIIAYFTLPFSQAAMASKMAEIAAQNPAAAANAQKFAGGFGLVFAPIVFAFILVIVTTVLWVTVSVFGVEGKWGTLLSVSTYTAITGVLLQAIGLVVLMMKGVDQVTSPQDLQPALGLNLLVPGVKGFLGAFLGGINPFAIWGVVLNAIGIQVTHKTSKNAAYGAAIAAAVVLLIILSGLASLQK